MAETTELKLAKDGLMEEAGMRAIAPIRAHFRLPCSLPIFPMFHTAKKTKKKLQQTQMHVMVKYIFLNSLYDNDFFLREKMLEEFSIYHSSIHMIFYIKATIEGFFFFLLAFGD